MSEPSHARPRPAPAVVSPLLEAKPVRLGAMFGPVRHSWRTVAAVALLFGLTGLGLALRRTPGYTSEFSLSPEARQNNAGAGIAAQLGIQLGGSAGGSLAFYSNVLTSRALLEPLLATHVAGLPPTVRTLADLVAPDKPAGPKRTAAAVERMQKAIVPTIDNSAGIIRVAVTARTPLLARSVGDSLIADLNAFNVRRRQAIAESDKEFAEQQLQVSGADVRNAENALAAFLEENRSRIAPRLSIDEDRLRREVQFRQQLYTGLVQDYQRAKLDEARNDMPLTIIDPPSLPVQRNTRGGLIGLLAGLLIGGMLGMGWVYLREYRAADPT